MYTTYMISTADNGSGDEFEKEMKDFLKARCFIGT